MRPTPIKQSEKPQQQARHKWSMFSSPPNVTQQDRSAGRSMFEDNSTDDELLNRDRISACVINNTPESLSGGCDS